MYHLWRKSQQRIQDLEKGSVSTNKKLLKIQRSHAADAKILGKPHLLNLANEILQMCKGRIKPNPTKNTFSALKGDKMEKFNILTAALNLKKAKSNASIAALSPTGPKEWATAFDRIHEVGNLGIHSDTWTEIDKRAKEACDFLKKHQYLYRSCAMEAFIISNRNTFKTNSL